MTRFPLAAGALAAALVAATAWADLRTYDVPPQYQQEIFAALSNVLQPQGIGSASGGRVQLLPSGQIVVNAAPETLDQVEQVMQAIRSSRAPAAPRVELRYWAVLGSRAAAPNPSGNPGTLSALRPVLAELERVHGNLTFRVIGSAVVATDSGQNGQVEGTTLDVSQRIFVQGESLNARINMELQNNGRLGPEVNLRGEIEVQTTLRRGEFVVLGQTEVVGGGLDGPVFFIVNWPEK